MVYMWCKGVSVSILPNEPPLPAQVYTPDSEVHVVHVVVVVVVVAVVVVVVVVVVMYIVMYTVMRCSVLSYSYAAT